MIEFLRRGLPLFFASTAGIAPGGGDGGAADAGDAGGGAEVPDGSDADVPADTGPVEDGAEEVESPETEPGDENPDGELETTSFKRAKPQDVVKALNELKKTNPGVARELRKAVFDNQSFRKAFESPAAAAEVRESIDGLEAYDADGGKIMGEDALPLIQQEAQDYARELSAMRDGDPGLIDEMARDFPEGLAKLTPVALDRLSQVNPQAYERLSGGIISRTLRDKGVTHSVERLMELISDGKQQSAHEMAGKILSWMRAVEQVASSEPENREQLAPRDRELSEREQELDRRERTSFTRSVAASVNEGMKGIIERKLAPYLKTRKLTLDQRKELAQGVYSRITEALKNDSGYQKRLRALLERGDSRAVARFVNSHVEERAGKAVASKWAASGFGGSKPNGNGRPQGTPGVLKLAKPPDSSQIDWSKDRDRMRHMSGEATLKNGKVVRWSWDNA